MTKHLHELRDPIHGFIRFDSQERRVLDSRPVQRLRHIHQLALSYLLYPGATHRRFEHSLGVMELAGRVFDIVTQQLTTDVARDLVENYKSDLGYWRRVVRMAALCHDIGHLPFSHAAEDELLPEGWNHERITDELILGDGMKPLWEAVKVQPRDVAKLALGPKKFGPKKHRDESFSPWEAILAEIIVGDAFGVDRMDYLLRDSHHAGVAYGKFDHFRLIDTLRLLPHPDTDEPTLGIEDGGVHSAEALLLARYFIYTQVYFHHVRRAYDYHLTEFLREWLPGGRFPTNAAEHLSRTDNEVTTAILAAAADPTRPGHVHARRITDREHYRLIYRRNPIDLAVNRDAARQIEKNLAGVCQRSDVHYYSYTQKSGGVDFPVLLSDGAVVSCINLSEVLRQVPVLSVEFVFIAPERKAEADRHLEKNKAQIIQPVPGPAE